MDLEDAQKHIQLLMTNVRALRHRRISLLHIVRDEDTVDSSIYSPKINMSNCSIYPTSQ